jgi:hypothetical protein
MNGKRHLIKSKLVIFCRFSTKKLFTLKLIIYISSHVIHFELFYTSMNLEIDAINKFVLYVDNIYIFYLMLFILNFCIHQRI